MIYIYQADSAQLAQKNKLKDLLQKLPVSMHERALRYIFETDAFNFVLGRLLLKEGLEKLGLENQLDKIAYHENGKPYLSTVAFNISHSDDVVVCAISTDGRLGVDVEKEKDIALEDFKTWWFTEREWSEITNSDQPSQAFFRYWTRKESIIKALGVNLSYLHEIELDSAQDFFIAGGRRWHLRDLDFGVGYFGAVCSEVEIQEIELILK